MKNIKCVVFDMDGTILDSMPFLERLGVEMIAYHCLGGDVQAAEIAYRRTVGRPFKDQLEVLFPGDSRNSLRANIYANRHQSEAPLFRLAPDVKRGIGFLKHAGLKTALISSTSSNIVFQTPAITLPFDHVFGVTLELKKPGQLNQVIQMVGCQPSEVLYMGDAEYDREIAIGAGTQFLLTDVNRIMFDIGQVLSALGK